MNSNKTSVNYNVLNLIKVYNFSIKFIFFDFIMKIESIFRADG